MVRFVKLNRIARVLIFVVRAVIAIVNLIYFIGPTGTDVIESDQSLYRTINELSSTSKLFAPLDEPIVTEFVAVSFPMGVSRKHEDFRGYDRYVIFGGQGDPVGYVYEVQEDLRCPVCNNVRLLVALDAAGEIKEIQVLESLELSGDPMPVAEESRFFKQFTSDRNEASKGQPSFVLGENVDGITGATKSSIHITEALNRLLFTHRG